MQSIQQDLLLITDGYIGHSCNCMGAMGGLAGAIKAKYPIVYDEYLKYLKSLNTRRQALGTIQEVVITDNFRVLNMFGQFGYGRKDANHMTDYNAFREIAKELNTWSKDKQSKLYLPYMLGCGLGGGDWNIVQDIFKDIDGYWCYKS
jgi:O-acetyl-ADP-ribose deacetylase (regulator of RNase III)